MGSPIIKAHIVPEGFDPAYTDISDPDTGQFVDIKTINTANNANASWRTADLIEFAVDGTLVLVNDPNPGFEKHTMIKLKQQTAGSLVYVVDVGAGAYHNTTKSNFFNENNWVRSTGGGNYALEKWLVDHKQFDPPGGTSNPHDLQFQLFVKKTVSFMGVLGSAQQISQNFVYVPPFGGYSYHWNEEGYPSGAISFFGELKPTYQVFNSTKDTWEWGGGLNYTVDATNNSITFSQSFYDKENIGLYEIYVRCWIKRTGNQHSISLSGVSRSNDNVYYALPHDDLVSGSAGGVTALNGGGTQIQQGNIGVYADQGIISFDRTDPSLTYPASGNTVVISEYKFHRWIRPTNDMVDDLLFKKYLVDGVNSNSVHNFDNSDDVSGNVPFGKDGHVSLSGANTQKQQQFVNFSFVDLKITNEATYLSDGSADLLNFYLDAIPRGKTYGLQDAEQIIQGIGGMVNDRRPWDHHEGSVVETSGACFARVARDYNLFRLAPKVTVDPTFLLTIKSGSSGQYTDYNDVFNFPRYENQMEYMNAAQAWRIRKWYKSSGEISTGKRFLVESSGDNIMASSQSGSAITLRGVGFTGGVNQDIIYARIVYSLYYGGSGGDQSHRHPVSTAIKSWTLRIRGEYIPS